jgi:putative ABC transport system permease protein
LAVTLQLAVSVVFIVAALVVMMQMRFVSHKDLGFDSTGVIRLSGLSFVPMNKAAALMHEFSAIPQIESFTFAYFEPQHNAKTSSLSNKVEWQGKLQSDNPVFHTIATDSRFAETFGLKMLMGEWFGETGYDKIVLNEEAVRVMELSEPVGAIIRLGDAGEEYTVAGVVKDFHALSLRSRILPTILFTSKQPIDILYFRVVPGQEQEAIQRIDAILSGINVSLADVNLATLTELYDRLNRSEQAGLKLFSVLATVCLLISLFGIYAVATAATQRRRKEIAIRKVFGAEVSDIVRMFFREHTLQVIIAGVVALPFAYYAMFRWLQGYAYRTNIPWWLLAGVITAIVAVVLLTVLGQVLKAANSNPAEVVKSE